MKTKFKVLVAMLVAICITTMGTVVNAATEFSDEDKDLIVTFEEDLGLGDIKIEGASYCFKLSDGYYTFFGEGRALGVEQSKINELADALKKYKVEIKYKLPSDISVGSIDKIVELVLDSSDTFVVGDELTNIKIEEINGNKYLVMSSELSTGSSTDVVTENDRYVDLYIILADSNKRMRIIQKDGNNFEVNVDFRGIMLFSENYVDNDQAVVNKYGSEYTYSISSGANVPTTADLKETYYKLYVAEYQGESIKVDGFGTLIYSGIEYRQFLTSALISADDVDKYKKVYVYTNSLDNLSLRTKNDERKLVYFMLKNKDLAIIIDVPVVGDGVEEPTVSGEAKSQETSVENFPIEVTGKGLSAINAITIESTDALYKKLYEGFESNATIDEEKYEEPETIAFDIHKVGDSNATNYEGKLTITFNVGTKYNDSKYVIGHLKNGLIYECFEGIVKDGKITIEVESLSPFMLTLAAKKEDDKKDPVTPEKPTTPENPTTPEEPTTPENPTTPEEPTTPEVPNTKPNTDTKVDTDKKGELDETPKTGSEKLVSNVVSLSSITALISLAGVVVCKKEQ